MKNNQPLVSINIPTFNSASTFEKTLASIKAQHYPNIEIVVVDGYSKDDTLKIARKYGVKVGYALAVGEARKLAYEISKGKYIFYLDSDQTIGSDVVSKLVDECESGGWDAITIFEDSMILNNSYLEKVIAYDKWVFHTLEDDDAIMGAAIPRFFRRSILSKINWPTKLFMFEHNAIYLETLAAGAKVKFRPDIHFNHYEQNTLVKYIKRFYHYGQSYPICLKYYPKEVLAHSLPRRAYFSIKALSNPPLWLGVIGLYVVKGLSAGFGAIAYLTRGGIDERTNALNKEKGKKK
jgi:glycosyltransferase involved in cell wall biosynthesis